MQSTSVHCDAAKSNCSFRHFDVLELDVADYINVRQKQCNNQLI